MGMSWPDFQAVGTLPVVTELCAGGPIRMQYIQRGRQFHPTYGRSGRVYIDAADLFFLTHPTILRALLFHWAPVCFAMDI